MRDVSILGRVKLINTLALSHLNVIAMIQNARPHHIKRINKILYEFLWAPRKIEQLSRSKVTRRKEDGGIGLPDLTKRLDALFFSRPARIFGFQPEELTEAWHHDMIYQIGSRMRQINPNLYSNAHPNAPIPDYHYKKIFETFNKINTPGFQWKDTKTKQIYNLLNTRTTTSEEWYKVMLQEPNIKWFFSNREREIAWRTKTGAYKWTHWIAQQHNRTAPCLFCNRGEDTINHMLTQCTYAREIWVAVNVMINETTSKFFIISNSLIKYNTPPNDESQESWLIPLKMVNIVKSNLIHWRQRLYLTENKVEHQNEWTQSVLDQARDDFNSFLNLLRSKNIPDIYIKFNLREEQQ